MPPEQSCLGSDPDPPVARPQGALRCLNLCLVSEIRGSGGLAAQLTWGSTWCCPPACLGCDLSHQLPSLGVPGLCPFLATPHAPTCTGAGALLGTPARCVVLAGAAPPQLLLTVPVPCGFSDLPPGWLLPRGPSSTFNLPQLACVGLFWLAGGTHQGKPKCELCGFMILHVN